MTVSIATLTKIIEVQTAISAELSVSRVMQTVAESAQVITNAAGAVVELAEGEDMVYRAASGLANNSLGVRLKVAGSLSGLCVRTARVLCCRDSETDDRVDRTACRRVGVRSMLVVPLLRDGGTIGVLKVISDVPDAFTETDVQVLEMMSNLIAGAMHNAARYESSISQSLHDSLTGLPNRVLFREQTARELTALARHRRGLAVLYCDLDGFKPVNDRYGHKTGDELLVAVAGRMRQNVRQCDTVARLGGDEFAILAGDLAGRREADDICDRLVSAIEREPFDFSGATVTVGASIGVAYLEEAIPIEAFLEQADMEMYTAKRQRKSRQYTSRFA